MHVSIYAFDSQHNSKNSTKSWSELNNDKAQHRKTSVNPSKIQKAVI